MDWLLPLFGTAAGFVLTAACFEEFDAKFLLSFFAPKIAYEIQVRFNQKGCTKFGKNSHAFRI